MATTKGLMGYSSDRGDFGLWIPTKTNFDTYYEGAAYKEYRKVLTDYNELQKKYSDLQTKYDALQNNYIKLASSLINCQSPLDEEEKEKIKII